MVIEEKGVRLKLTVVDTPGFGDAVNGQECWKPVQKYIDSQFDQYFRDESGLNRKNISDNRVHCCLYFISPYGHGLKPIDVEFMKELHEKVNIVPVIGKADVLTATEMAQLKHRIMKEIEFHKIKIYKFPECDEDEDEEARTRDKELKASVPFTVIGSNAVVEVNRKRVRARVYPWGIVEVDNPRHCDFGKLRTMLISTHMQDLKDVTRDLHYEAYRSKFISRICGTAAGAGGGRDRTTAGKLKRNSSDKVPKDITDQLIQEKDEELRRMQQMLNQMRAKLACAPPAAATVR